jgi:glucose/arabinose dehydrogenase
MRDIRTDSFEFDVTDRGAGEEIGPELARVSVPQSIETADRATMLRNLPPVPAGIELPEMAAAMVELERVRAAYAAARQAVNAAENRRTGARAEDAAAGAAAFRSGKDAVGPSAVQSLEAEIRELVARRDAGAVAVAQAENELSAAIETNRTAYLALLSAAVEADRRAALSALDDFAASRTRLLTVMEFRSWLGGTRKWRINLAELRGLGQPAPRVETILDSLRRELTW